MSGGLHARQNSIKRTPSDLSLSLAAADLPPPSAITNASKSDQADQATQGINNRIGALDLDEPEGEQSVPPFSTGVRRSPSSSDSTCGQAPACSARGGSSTLLWTRQLTLVSYERTALTLADRKRESDRAQEAVASALSSLELGIPERVSRANARADGATTPIPV